MTDYITRLANSGLVEDRYIAHLGGMQTGKRIVEFIDKNTAFNVQHPIGNRVCAGIIGSINSIYLTLSGVMAYPIVNESMRSTFLGSKYDICTVCGLNAYYSSTSGFDLNKLLNDKDHSYFNNLGASIGKGFMNAGSCFEDDNVLDKCRIANYMKAYETTLSNNIVLIGAVGIGLTAYFYCSVMDRYAKQDIQKSEKFKKDLTDRYEKIATRLKAFKGTPEIQQCAKNILVRKQEIKNELASLQLSVLFWKDPALSLKDIEQITKPVFDAAEELLPKDRS